MNNTASPTTSSAGFTPMRHTYRTNHHFTTSKRNVIRRCTTYHQCLASGCEPKWHEDTDANSNGVYEREVRITSPLCRESPMPQTDFRQGWAGTRRLMLLTRSSGTDRSTAGRIGSFFCRTAMCTSADASRAVPNVTYCETLRHRRSGTCCKAGLTTRATRGAVLLKVKLILLSGRRICDDLSAQPH
jgi:hypothetical protein